MLPILSRQLDSLSLVFRTKPVVIQAEPKLTISRSAVSFPSRLLEADEMIGILDEIALEEAADPVPGWDDPNNTTERQRRSRRAVWRLGSFVVFLCSLDRVLAKQHEWMAQTIEHFVSLPPPDLTSEKAAQKAALEPVRKWRDKVFAHTAYADPRKEDSSLLKANTLAYASGSIATILGDAFVLGGGGYGYLDAPSEPNPLKPVSMKDLLGHAEACITAWRDMLRKTFDPLWQLSDREIMERCTCARIEVVARCEAAASSSPTSVTQRSELGLA